MTRNALRIAQTHEIVHHARAFCACYVRHLAPVTQRYATQRIPHHFVMGVSFDLVKGPRSACHGPPSSAIVVVGGLYRRAENREK